MRIFVSDVLQVINYRITKGTLEIKSLKNPGRRKKIYPHFSCSGQQSLSKILRFKRNRNNGEQNKKQLLKQMSSSVRDYRKEIWGVRKQIKG